jgi:hypothetical protein
MTNFETLRAELEKINKAIEAEKIHEKLEKMRLCHKTAHRYYSLQELYMNTIMEIK